MKKRAQNERLHHDQGVFWKICRLSAPEARTTIFVSHNNFCQLCRNLFEQPETKEQIEVFLALDGMAKSNQEVLKEAWLGGVEGCMSGQTQAKAWALREAWKDQHGDKTYGMLTHIQSKLYVIGPPKQKKKENPTNTALHLFFQKIDSDKEGWYPGKNNQKKRGPDPVINGTNRNVIITQCDEPQGERQGSDLSIGCGTQQEGIPKPTDKQASAQKTNLQSAEKALL